MFSVTDAEVEWTKIERIVSYLRSHGFGILLFISHRNNDFFPSKQWNANNDAIETGFDAFAFYRQRGNNFSLVPSFVRCVIISKCCQNMPIIPTSLLLPPTAPGSPSSPTHLALSQHLSCHRYHRNRWRFSFFFFGIISGTCRYIRFSFQNQCIASFGASFYNIIVKLYASSQQKNLRGKNRARKRERQADRQKRWHEKSRYGMKKNTNEKRASTQKISGWSEVAPFQHFATFRSEQIRREP